MSTCFAYIANKLPYYPIHFIAILVVLNSLMIRESHAQCAVDPDSILSSPREALSKYTTIKIVGDDIQPGDLNINIENSSILYIPTDVTFSGSISKIDDSSALCIEKGGVFNGSYSNIDGTLYNFNTTTTLNLTSVYKGSIENYGGIINITDGNEIATGRYILNIDGVISWNKSINISTGAYLYNAGLFFQDGDGLVLSGTGCIHNDGWLTIENYVGANDFFNYGKVEILGTKLHFNSGGEVFNYCSFFSYTQGAEFQNSIDIYNYGLIYFPEGTWYNKKTFTNGEKGTVRTYDLTNENGTVTGRGKFYVAGYSKNYNGNATFGLSGDTINFYDASNTNNPGHFDENTQTIGNAVYYTEFPEPEYSPDLSLYECGEIILSEIDAGEIGSDQVVCQGMTVQPFKSLSAAYMDGNPTIKYQWQYKFPGDEYFTDVSGANTLDYDPDTATVDIQYRRKAFFTFSDNPIKDCKYASNIVSIIISDETPPEITAHPTDTTVCPGSPASFTVALNDDSNNQFQWMSKASTEQEWAPINESEPYTGTTSKTLHISNTENLTSYQFACEVSSEVCGAVLSNSAQVVHFPDSLPTLTAPEDQYLCVHDSSAQFTVETESENITFQWQESTDGGTSWTTIADGENYQGVNTNNLVVSVDSLVNENQYKCIATSGNGCFEAQSGAATLYNVEPEVTIEPTASIKCPDTDPELNFNGIDSNYQMGNSVITFLIQRNTIGPFAWSFSYQLDVSNPELLVDSQSQGNINISDTNTTLFPLTFYIENQTEEIVTATLNISNVEVAGCSESSGGNPNHTASMQVHKMPLVGEFKKD